MILSRRTFLTSSAAATALTAGAFSGCQNAAAPGMAAAAQSLLDEATEFMLTAYPESASSAGLDKGARSALKAQLTDRSLAGQAKIESQVRDIHKRLGAIDLSALEPDQALNIEVVRETFDITTAGFDFPFGDVAQVNSNWSYRNTPYVVAQNVGAFVEIPSFLDSSHAIENAQDAEDYISRMRAYAGQIAGETERLIGDSEAGMVLPDFLLAKTAGQIRGALERQSESWGLVTSLTGRASAFGDYGPRAIEIIDSDIRPALNAQLDALERFTPKASDKAGIMHRPRGEDYYDWTIRAATTTTMNAKEVHQMGLDELASLQSRMEPILQSIGYTQGTVGARMAALADDPAYQFSDGDKGRAEIFAFIEDKIAEIRALMPQAFHTLVPGFLEVTRINPDVEAGAPGAYGGAGSIDGTKPGHFWINLRTPKLHNKFSLADLTYHEAIPGHVWQGEYTFKQPLIRSLMAFNAYSEGWALYAQQIADELGVYDDFPVGRLGYLQSLAFRACRLVVDSGLHAKGWTREQAIDWFVTNNGSSREEVAGEIDRYCAWPGQALGYKIGHTRINQLRDKARAVLGERYDYRAFNDAVVLGGAVPMTVLGRVIDDHIAAQKA